MGKTIIVLNDGTDEIFNIHAIPSGGLDQFEVEYGNTYFTSMAIRVMIDSNPPEEFNLVSWLVRKDAENRFFRIVHLPYEMVEQLCQEQNEACREISFGRKDGRWRELSDVMIDMGWTTETILQTRQKGE